MTPRALLRALPEAIVHGASAFVVVALLVAVGQPIFTDDLWWHLGMGGEYAIAGPWLDRDPFLFAAERPAEPAAWLFDVGLHALHAVGGFPALRLLHVAVVAVILGLAWTMLRRVGGSRAVASLGTAVFAALAAYRFFQLRPHLFTILAAMIVVRLLVIDRRPPGAGRIAAVAAVIAIWANVHGAFVLGLVLIGAALGGSLIDLVPSRGRDALGRSRTLRLAGALLAGTAAACLNPAGPRFLLLYFTAGADTPSLSVVADEWAPVRLFAAPLLNVPPTPLTLALVWILLLLTPVLNAAQLRSGDRDPAGGSPVPRLDGAAVAVAAVSLAGLLVAVRLLWMGLFVELAAVGAGGALVARFATPRRRAAWAAAAAVSAVLLVPGFLRLGDWTMISRGLHRATYARPYSTAKYHAHGVWFLRDAGLRGRAWSDYWIGNFLSYWLPPELQLFVNGSLNVPKDVMEAAGDIRARRPDAAGRTTPELLEAYGVDVFIGTGVPVTAPPGRPHPDTTRHLERTPGWRPIFRNVQTALYLRDGPENRENLARVAAWYEAEGVPFDPEVGFDPARAIAEAPDWSIAHGLIPPDHARLKQATRTGPIHLRRAAEERLSSIDLLLGLYDRAAKRDERLAASGPTAVFAGRRLVWSLLHAGRIEAAVEAADRLAARAEPDDRLSRLIVDAAHSATRRSETERAELLARLPVFTRPQGQWAASGFVAPEPRPGRR